MIPPESRSQRTSETPRLPREAKLPALPRGPAGIQARWAAVHALMRVDDGAGSAEALSDALQTLTGNDPRDRGLVTELVYGALRRCARLDAALAAGANRGLKLKSAGALWALRLGAYQLLFLDRVPDHAAISTTVELARHFGGPGEARFCNALLRRLQRAGSPPSPPAGKPAWVAMSHIYSHPEWIVRAWIAEHGEARAEALARSYDSAAPVTVRLRASAHAEEGVKQWLEKHPDVQVSAGQWPNSLMLKGQVDPVLAEPFERGWWMPQDEGSQMVVRAADVPAGARVLELCAGTGTKTTDLAERVGSEGIVWAVDIDARKLERNRALLERFGLSDRVQWSAVDAATPDATQRSPAQWQTGDLFDVAVVDAPCTGLGAMRRRPEVKWRRTVHDVAKLAPLQLALIRSAAHRLRPGGRLIYAVCTFTRAEGQGVVEAAMAEMPWLVVEPPTGADADGFLRPSPDLGTGDGFFIARLRREGSA